MDTALKNGDFAENETGKIYLINGMQETLQRCKILLSVKQGEFCYNKNLGGNLHKLNTNDENLTGNALLLVKEALLPVKQVEVISVIPILEGEQIKLSITISAYNQTGNLEVTI